MKISSIRRRFLAVRIASRRIYFAVLAIILHSALGGPAPAAQEPASQQSPTQQSNGQPSQSQPDTTAPNLHAITVTFSYDFTKNPACSPKVTTKTCIKQFDVYDVSGRKYRLFSIPVPADASGQVKTITGRGPSRAFEPGLHFIAVTAENASGVESDFAGCRTKVQVPPPVASANADPGDSSSEAAPAKQ